MKDFLRNPRPQRPEQAPETGTFEERLIRCRPKLLQYAGERTEDNALIEDLVQQTLLNALEQHSEKPEKDIRDMNAWTKQILRNLYANHLRFLRARNEVGGQEAEEVFETAESPEPELGDAYDKPRIENRKHNLIDQLSAKQYEVVTSRLKGEPYKVIAKKMGISPRTVEEQLDRAQKKLRKEMAE